MSNGAVFSGKDVRDYTVEVSEFDTFPQSFSLPMPDVKDQGRSDACVSFAIATIAEYHCRRFGDEMRELSPFYNYANRRETDWVWPGLHIRDALKTMVKYGIVTKQDFRYVGEVPAITDLFEEEFDNVFEKGIPNRFEAFCRLTTDREMKKSLTCHGPAIISVEWYDDILVTDGVLTTNAIHKNSNGTHAMVVYGWSDDGWLIQNSHGKGWGDGGRAVLPYDVPWVEAWGIVDEISEKKREEEIRRLQKINADLGMKVEELLLKLETLNFFKEESEKDKAEISALTAMLADALTEIEKKNAKIALLNSHVAQLKKPFSSPIGRIAAAIINFVLKRG